jgi:spermidine synthase
MSDNTMTMIMRPPSRSVLQTDGRIFFVSVLILYLELVLIRWIGTEIRIFAYLGNLILVVCFFGIGLGCYQADRPIAFSRLGINLLLIAVLVANPFGSRALDLTRVAELLNAFDDSLIWGAHSATSAAQALVGLSVVALLACLVMFTFVPAGQVLGRAFQHHPRVIRAYSVNIAGSLAGVWLFNATSWSSAPPPVWFALAALLVLPLAAERARQVLAAAGLLAIAAVAVWLGRDNVAQTIWSPYHKLMLSPFHAGDGPYRVQQGYVLEVNGAFYQHMLNLSEDFLRAHPEVYDPDQIRYSHYNLPFVFQPGARRMLIVGAGSGNDAAAALRHGVEQIVCVEIDPQIYALGKQLHPERPYDSERVRVVINDARAYFKQAVGPYDLIWFGWLDSHTLGSSYNNLRLDHYVYTRESLAEARQLLADDGVLVLSFGAERRWIADRLFGVLRDAFGHPPLAYADPPLPREFGGGGNLTLVTARQPVRLERIRDDQARQFVRQHLVSLPGETRVTTDDWPYLYLHRAKIPNLHLVVILTILATVALGTRRVFGLRAGGLDRHFFALGAAFLLLQVQTVSRATLLFGMTWVVTAIVISAVLVMILAANLIAARWPRLPQAVIFTGLAVSVAALAVVPLDWFNMLTGPAKLIVASAFLTAPVFFAGLIFIRSFAACADRPRALGANLVGALAGGLLESVSFLTGTRALVVLVGLFYLLAVLSRPKSRPAPLAASQPAVCRLPTQSGHVA